MHSKFSLSLSILSILHEVIYLRNFDYVQMVTHLFLQKMHTIHDAGVKIISQLSFRHYTHYCGLENEQYKTEAIFFKEEAFQNQSIIIPAQNTEYTNSFCQFFSDYLFKLLLIGDSGVGKSCLLLRFSVSRAAQINKI